MTRHPLLPSITIQYMHILPFRLAHFTFVSRFMASRESNIRGKSFIAATQALDVVCHFIAQITETTPTYMQRIAHDR